MAAMVSARWVLALVPFALLVACGGESFRTEDDETGGTGGSVAGSSGTSHQGGSAGTSDGGSGPGTGGTGVAGSGVGGTGVAGTGAGGAGVAGTGFGGDAGTGNCLAFPTCPAGEVQVPGPDYCTPGEPCRPVALCGYQIWCTVPPSQCDAYPSCDPGDTTLTSPCPPEYSCYERSLCGSTVWCVKAECNPDTEYNRQYLFKTCESIDWDGCTLPNTTMFENECGCGCEQDETCPPHLGCYVKSSATPTPSPGGDDAPAQGGTGSGSGAAPAPPPPVECDPAELARCPFSAYDIIPY